VALVYLYFIRNFQSALMVNPRGNTCYKLTDDTLTIRLTKELLAWLREASQRTAYPSVESFASNSKLQKRKRETDASFAPRRQDQRAIEFVVAEGFSSG
jgi:hypothetical protein